MPDASNQAVEPAVFDILKADFSACELPYSQAVNVSRSYLRMLGSARIDTMRHFRKCITEFPLDPVNPPTGFQSHLWRLPARIEIAIEYLGITSEEYETLFKGTPPLPCAAGQAYDPKATDRCWAPRCMTWPGRDGAWTTEVSGLSQFLRLTCLTYCEFLELYDAVLAPPARDGRAPQSPLLRNASRAA